MRLIFLLLCTSLWLFAKTINIASYNVENLFDGVNDGTEYKDYKLNSKTWNKKTAKLKYSHTLKAIKSIKADIIALQEIENLNLMKKLANDLGYEYFAFSKQQKAPVGIGLLSKYKIINQRQIYAGIDKTRNFLHVDVKIQDEIISFFVVHFPTLKYSISKRQKVANTLKNAVDKLKNKNIILLGDFNTPISNNSILARSFGDLNDKVGFFDPWTNVPYTNRYSHAFYGKKSAIDRILLSESFFDLSGFEYVKNSFKVVKNDFLSDFKGNPNRWKGKQHGYSDHFPIMLSISDNKIINKSIKNISIDDIYSMKNGQVEFSLKDAVVIYKSKYGVILSQGKRGIFLHEKNSNLLLNHKYDIRVNSINEYKNIKQINAYDILKKHSFTDTNKYYIDEQDILHVKVNDVVKSVSGEVENGFIRTKYGDINIFNLGKLKLNKYETFLHVRVGVYKGKMQLILEDHE